MTSENKLIVKGEGEPLVFLHGFMCSKEIFAQQISYFSKYFKVYAYDLCGFGCNNYMPYPYKLDDYVKEFLSVIDGIGEKVNVVAHSFGCRVILKTLIEHDVINKAVLTGAAGLKPRFSLKKSLKKNIYKIVKPIIKREKLEKIFFSKDYLMTSGNLKKSFSLVTGEYFDNSIKNIKIPILAVYGEKDRETPLYMGKRLAKEIESCNLYVVKNSGHFCFIDKSKEFNYVVREFLL